jgi:hypothetical protein
MFVSFAFSGVAEVRSWLADVLWEVHERCNVIALWYPNWSSSSSLDRERLGSCIAAKASSGLLASFQS